MLAELFNAVVGLAKKSESAAEMTHLRDLPDGRSMLVNKDGTTDFLHRPRSVAFQVQTIESFVLWLADRTQPDRDDQRPCYINGDGATFHDLREDDDGGSVIEYVAKLGFTHHADFQIVCKGLLETSYRPKELVTLGRTIIADLFIDRAQSKAWRETFQSIVATSGKELRTEVGSTKSNYGIDVKSEVRSNGGSIESWDEFELNVRVFEQLPEFRVRVKLALIPDGENGTFTIKPVGSTLVEAKDKAIEKAREELAGASGRKVIRGTAPNSLLPTIKV